MGVVTMERDIYTIDEVADILRVHRRTIRNAMDRGELEAFIVGREYRITADALKRYQELKRVKPKKEKEAELIGG